MSTAPLRRAEYHFLERVKPRGVYVLDHLHGDRGVIAGQSLIPVGERPVQQFDALPLLSGQGIEVQALVSHALLASAARPIEAGL